MQNKLYMTFFFLLSLYHCMSVFASEELQRDINILQQRHSLTQVEKEVLLEYVLRQPFRSRRLLVQDMLQGANETFWQYLYTAEVEQNMKMLSDIEEPEDIAFEKGIESNDIFSYFISRIRFRDFSHNIDADMSNVEEASLDDE